MPSAQRVARICLYSKPRSFVFDLFDPVALPAQIYLRVTPGARQPRIKREEREGSPPLYRIYVTEVAEDGKANAAVLSALSKALGVPYTSLTITHGLTTRDKVVAIKQG